MSSNQTILVGIDYSKSSENAVNYAIKLADRKNNPIMLFHVYETPMAHTYSGIYFVSFNDIDRYNKKKLDNYKDKLLAKHPKLNISTFTTFTSFKQGVKDLLKKHKIGLVVLGLGSKTRFSKFLYGTTGVDVAGKVNCPVIIIPEKYHDYHFRLNTVSVDNRKYLKLPALNKIRDFSKKFGISNDFVHVKTPDEFLIPASERISKQDKKLKVKTIESDDFSDGIVKYVNTSSSDMVTVISHSHSILYNLFNETNTKLIAFRSNKPVMAVHD